MMNLLSALTLAVIACVCYVEARKNWALLIAGSAGYENYRHQADICHAYQILHKAGIPDEQIVVMMYDDIAQNDENPFKGNIINKPNGPNVYPGVPKDYTGNEVNTQTFLAVLQGNKEEVHKLLGRDGKVIDSGPDDYIFVNFVDHGGPGLLCMPDGTYLIARTLNDVLKKLHKDKKFAKLVFYVEACESGSMFYKLLPNDINVYVTTAANQEESSWSCYYDATRNALLGDVYSVNWMENADTVDLHNETLEQQYEIVQQETNTSHVQQFGDLTFHSLTLDTFFGEGKQIHSSSLIKLRPYQTPIRDVIPSEMVGIHLLKTRIEAAPVNSVEKRQLEEKLVHVQKTMKQTHKLIWDIARTVYSGLPEDRVFDLALKDHNDIENWDCYEIAVEKLLAYCPGLKISTNDFALRKFYVLVNLCNNNSLSKVITAVEAASVVNPLCHA